MPDTPMKPKEWAERMADEFAKDCKRFRSFVADNSAQCDGDLKKPMPRDEAIERFRKAIED